LKRFNGDDGGQSAAASLIYSVAKALFLTRQDQKTVPIARTQASDLVGVMCSNNGGNDPAYRRDERADESSSVTAGGTTDWR
jgi:hypothetical protein